MPKCLHAKNTFGEILSHLIFFAATGKPAPVERTLAWVWALDETLTYRNMIPPTQELKLKVVSCLDRWRAAIVRLT